MAVWVPFPHPASFHVLEGSVVTQGAANAATAAAVFKAFGGSLVEQEVFTGIKNISEPARQAMLGMSNPKVEFTLKGDPVESSPGSGDWSVRFLAYVREG